MVDEELGEGVALAELGSPFLGAWEDRLKELLVEEVWRAGEKGEDEEVEYWLESEGIWILGYVRRYGRDDGDVLIEVQQ